MIADIIFKNTYRTYLAGTGIKFRPGVNLLVGDNGTGKSSLIHLIRKYSDPLSSFAKDSVNISTDGETKIWSHDFEKDNIRTKSYFGDNMQFQISSMYSSHGEVSKVYLGDLLRFEEKGIIVLDEPDIGLSPASILMLIEAFKHIADIGGQIIASVHNLEIMRSFEPLFNMHYLPEIKNKKDKELIIDEKDLNEKVVFADLSSTTNEYAEQCKRRHKEFMKKFWKIQKENVK